MLKNILFVGIGFIFGAIFAVPAILFFLRTDSGQAVLRAYVVVAPQWPDVTTIVRESSGGGVAVSVAEALIAPIGARVPKNYANEAYARALNGVFSSVQELGTSSNKLGPLLIEINARSLSSQYEGFFDLIVQAKLLVAQQKELAGTLAQRVSALSVANQSTTDAVTKSLTQEVVAVSGPVQKSLGAYVRLLEQLLSGSVPSAELIRNLGDSVATLSADLAALGSALTELTKHFAPAVQ